jgi:sporulation protein YlmC with PRC-barrel domain
VKASITTMLILGALALSPIASRAAPAPPSQSDPSPISSDRMIGSPVYNETNQKIGTLQDVLIQPSSGESRLVLAVGDFVGHDKLVAVPVSRVAMQDGHLIIAGGTKEALEKLPAFSYRPR